MKAPIHPLISKIISSSGLARKLVLPSLNEQSQFYISVKGKEYEIEEIGRRSSEYIGEEIEIGVSPRSNR